MTDLRIERPATGVTVITFDRPERLNAMSAQGVRDLVAALDEVAGDPSVRVVVLTGAGRGFCSGHALDVLPELGGGGLDALYAEQELFASLTTRIRSMPQPVIAAVNGAAAGGGLAIALAADVRVCSTSARFNAAFVRLGLSGCDVGVSYLLPKVVGTTHAFEMMLTGRLVEAEEALRIGLVLEVVPDGEVLGAALSVAEQICANAPFGIRMTKQVMWANLDAPSLEAAIELENRTQVLCARTKGHREALQAFMEKRPAVFDGA